MSANLMSLASSGGKFLKLFGDRKMMKTMPTARDYVQDGLIAMWDGIENAGWGKHDQNATTWKDLVGGNDLVLQNTAHFDENSLVSADRNKLTALCSSKLPYASIEVCGFFDKSRNSSALVCFGNSVDDNRMFSCDTSSIQTYNGKHMLSLTTPADPKCTWAGVHDGNRHDAYVRGALAAGTNSLNDWGLRNGTFGLSGSSNYSSWNFVGNYYCVRLYSRALTVEELATNHAIDKARFNLKTHKT